MESVLNATFEVLTFGAVIVLEFPKHRLGDALGATLSSSWARRRSTFARVKFLSRLFTALNLLPSMATLAVAEKAHVTAELDEARTYLA